MAKGERKVEGTKGELLYTEKIPKSLRPRKVLAGKRWSYLENLGRITEVVLAAFLLVLATSTDLSKTANLANLMAGVVALVLMFYATEVLSPRGRRMSVPIKIYSKGLEVHTSALEEMRGYPPFIPSGMISKLVVHRIAVPHEGQSIIMPTNLTLVLSNGKDLNLGRRNYYELENMIKLMKEKFGVSE
jgi:branched-subunit amino acid transport protein